MTSESEWAPIVGYEGIYKINRNGDVRYCGNSPSGRGSRNKKTCLDRNGYVRVTLCKNGNSRQKLLHVLLADAFLPKKDGDYLVDHKDGNPSNNNLSNLRWADQSVNQLNRHKLVAKSGVTGVHRIKGSSINPWMALGKIEGKMIYLGVFASIEDARNAREAWESSVGCTTSKNIRIR